jgi:peptidoglycan/LPS O-acetylase OafA/YrhL
MEPGDRRVFGLDVVRAAAIVLVAASHVLDMNTRIHALRLIWYAGVLGVELFFVLSGYLIGGIILRLMHTTRFHTLGDLGHFWINRWFRTLPLYYLYLFVYSCIPLGVNPFAQLARNASYLVFAQNLAWPIPPFFVPSWSLSVEEWFYLVFPLLLFAAFALLRVPLRPSVVGTALLLMAFSLLARLVHGPMKTMGGIDLTLRTFVVFRFDALMLGVLLAFLHREAPQVWRGLVRFFPVALLLQLAVDAFMVFGWRALFILPWLQILIFPIISLSIALMLPFFAEWKQSTMPVRAPIAWVAKSSYSIYLVHLIAILAVLRFLPYERFGVWAPLTAFAGVFLLGSASYGLVEAPLMSLRSRWDNRFLQKRRVEEAEAHSAVESVEKPPG